MNPSALRGRGKNAEGARSKLPSAARCQHWTTTPKRAQPSTTKRRRGQEYVFLDEISQADAGKGQGRPCTDDAPQDRAKRERRSLHPRALVHVVPVCERAVAESGAGVEMPVRSFLQVSSPSL